MKEKEDRPQPGLASSGEQVRAGYRPSTSDAQQPPSEEAPRTGPHPNDGRVAAPYPHDPRHPASYPHPSWHHLPPGYPPPHHPYPDPAHSPYHYHPGPPADMSQPPQPRHPDPYRLPPPYPYPGYGLPHGYAPPPPPAPRQRTAIACKYCRKRKIRCSGYESSPDGRCNNCVRFNQSCLFHPVSSQAAFVPAQAVYPNMPNPRGEPPSGAGRGDHRPQGAYAREGEAPPVLYGAHGIPLAPATGAEQHGPYPPSAYPPHPYPGPPHPQAPPSAFENRSHGPPRPASEDGTGRKRGAPDEDSHNENGRPSQSPHPSARPRFSHEPRKSTSTSTHTNGYGYPEPATATPISPSTSSTSYHGPHPYPSSASHSARRNSPQSAHSFDSPRTLPIREDGKSTPPVQAGSAPGSANGRSGMSVQAMLGDARAADGDAAGPRRHKDDTEMLSKLDGKK